MKQLKIFAASFVGIFLLAMTTTTYAFGPFGVPNEETQPQSETVSVDRLKYCRDLASSIVEYEDDVESMGRKLERIDNYINSARSDMSFAESMLSMASTASDPDMYNKWANKYNEAARSERRNVNKFNRLNNRRNSKIDTYESKTSRYNRKCGNIGATSKDLDNVCVGYHNNLFCNSFN